MGGDIVNLFVGPERKRYAIHKNLLTKESDYFDKALNGAFKEAEDQSIDLPEESPATVDLLVGWLYQDKIPVVGSTCQPFVKNTSTPPSPSKPIFAGSGIAPGSYSSAPGGGPWLQLGVSSRSFITRWHEIVLRCLPVAILQSQH
jgi:hypothetical protein